MSIVVLGDSITEGVQSQWKNFCGRLIKEYGLNVDNCGIGGTRVARQTKPMYHVFDLDFNLRVPILDKDAEQVIVFGGTNDWGHGDAEFGNIGDTSLYNFTGAYQTLIKTLIERYGKEKVKIALPLRRYDDEKPNKIGKYLVDYVNREIEIANLYGIPYIDLFNNSLPKPATSEFSEYFWDGIHPNDNGHAVLAKIFYKFIMGKEPENK